MHATSLELLEKSALPPHQARAILQAVDTELILRSYATKDDLSAAKVELRAEIQATRASLELKIEGLRTEMHQLGTKLILWCAGSLLSAVGITISLFKWLK